MCGTARATPVPMVLPIVFLLVLVLIVMALTIAADIYLGRRGPPSRL